MVEELLADYERPWPQPDRKRAERLVQKRGLISDDNNSGRLPLSQTPFPCDPQGAEMAVTKQQVRVFMAQRSNGQTQTLAAAKTGISERTARRIDADTPVAGGKPRHWRTSEDSFSKV